MATNTLKCSLGIGGLRVSTSTTGPPRSHSSRIFSVLYHPTDPHMIVSAGWDRTVQVRPPLLQTGLPSPRLTLLPCIYT